MRITFTPFAASMALLCAVGVHANDNSVVLELEAVAFKPKATMEVAASDESTEQKEALSSSAVKQKATTKKVKSAELPVKQKTPIKVAKEKTDSSLPKLFIYKGESYKSAISRWFYDAGYKQMAWSISESMNKQLSDRSLEVKTYEGGLIASITALSKEIADSSGKKFYVSFDERNKWGAVHEWGNRYVKIAMVRGNTLKDVVRNLVKDYRFNWSDESSWRLPEGKNYEGFAIPFPIVAPSDDIMFALNNILKGRSVQAGVHAGTRTVFIYKAN